MHDLAPVAPTVGLLDPPTIERGARVPVDPKISVIVMSVNADARVANAVASVIDQMPTTEVIVVNTGSGSVKPYLAAHLEQIVVVEAHAIRLPGGTRNLGLAETTGAIVAFLAADCRATPGWIAGHLAAHEAGAQAVATALRPLTDADGRIAAVSWASHLAIHARRAPECPAARALRFGGSYDHSLFQRYGWFRDDLRTGEDADFNRRIAFDAPLLWSPHIVTLHDYPTRLGPALIDVVDRGRQLYYWHKGRGDRPLWRSIRQILKSWRFVLAFPSQTEGAIQRIFRQALPLATLLFAAYAWGAILAAARLPASASRRGAA